jgi:hypothetical protein
VVICAVVVFCFGCVEMETVGIEYVVLGKKMSKQQKCYFIK